LPQVVNNELFTRSVTRDIWGFFNIVLFSKQSLLFKLKLMEISPTLPVTLAGMSADWHSNC